MLGRRSSRDFRTGALSWHSDPMCQPLKVLAYRAVIELCERDTDALVRELDDKHQEDLQRLRQVAVARQAAIVRELHDAEQAAARDAERQRADSVRALQAQHARILPAAVWEEMEKTASTWRSCANELCGRYPCWDVQTAAAAARPEDAAAGSYEFFVGALAKLPELIERDTAMVEELRTFTRAFPDSTKSDLEALLHTAVERLRQAGVDTLEELMRRADDLAIPGVSGHMVEKLRMAASKVVRGAVQESHYGWRFGVLSNRSNHFDVHHTTLTRVPRFDRPGRQFLHPETASAGRCAGENCSYHLSHCVTCTRKPWWGRAGARHVPRYRPPGGEPDPSRRADWFETDGHAGLAVCSLCTQQFCPDCADDHLERCAAEMGMRGHASFHLNDYQAPRRCGYPGPFMALPGEWGFEFVGKQEGHCGRLLDMSARPREAVECKGRGPDDHGMGDEGDCMILSCEDCVWRCAGSCFGGRCDLDFAVACRLHAPTAARPRKRRRGLAAGAAVPPEFCGVCDGGRTQQEEEAIEAEYQTVLSMQRSEL